MAQQTNDVGDVHAYYDTGNDQDWFKPIYEDVEDYCRLRTRKFDPKTTQLDFRAIFPVSLGNPPGAKSMNVRGTLEHVYASSAVST